MGLLRIIRNVLHKQPRKEKRWRYKSDGITKYEID